MCRTSGLTILILLLAAPLAGAVEIQSIARLKGQEPVRLTGLGIITGLNGTGDSRFTPMHNAVARALGLLGNRVSDLREVAAVRNVALVMVTCEIPGVGGREGDTFDCFVSSAGTARSLAGGRLMRTTLRGPISADEKVYALAEGPVTIEAPETPNTGRIKVGAKLTEDLFAPFLKCIGKQDRITLVIDNAHATFVTSNRIADAINRTYQPQVSPDRRPVQIARAMDAKNVEVILPEFVLNDIVGFVADIMEIQMPAEFTNTQARVIINEKTGTIVVTGEVELTPVLMTHRNLIIFPPGTVAAAVVGAPPPNDFAPLINAGPPSAIPLPAKLNDLLIALNRAQVSADDKIAIVRELAKSGKLHATVIYE